jgi:hypothetical protein
MSEFFQALNENNFNSIKTIIQNTSKTIIQNR